MPQHARARQRGEGGFTLIELLVVMIIIAILMAVAVPTFLSQKQNAIKTQATSNVKQIVNAIESCGATTLDATYTGCNWTRLLEVEPTLSNIQPPPTVQVGANDFTVTVTTASGVSFTQRNTELGAIEKTCVANGEAGKKACPAGKW